MRLLLALLFLAALAAPARAQPSLQDAVFCPEGMARPCGTDTGMCAPGLSTCEGGHWSECRNEVRPRAEVCGSGLDEDCNGIVDDCEAQTPDIGLYLILAGVGLFLFGCVIAVKDKLGGPKFDVRQPPI